MLGTTCLIRGRGTCTCHLPSTLCCLLGQPEWGNSKLLLRRPTCPDLLAYNKFCSSPWPLTRSKSHCSGSNMEKLHNHSTHCSNFHVQQVVLVQVEVLFPWCIVAMPDMMSCSLVCKPPSKVCSYPVTDPNPCMLCHYWIAMRSRRNQQCVHTAFRKSLTHRRDLPSMSSSALKMHSSSNRDFQCECVHWHCVHAS